MEQNPNIKAYAALAIVCFFWGTTYLVIKIGVVYIPGFIFSGIRNTLAGLLTCGFFLLKGVSLPSRNVFWILVIRGILMVIIGNGLVHWAEQFISSGLAAIIAAMVPLFIVSISVIMFKSIKINLKIILGLLLGFAGILVIFSDSLEDFKNPVFVGGIIAMFAAAFGWALGSVYSGLRKLDINPIYAAGVQMFTGGILSIVIGFIIGERADFFALPINGIWAILYLVFIGSILGYNAYMYVLSKLPPTQASIYAYINPIVAVTLGWIILDEKLNLAIISGMAITLLGVFLVNRGFSLNIKKGI